MKWKCYCISSSKRVLAIVTIMKNCNNVNDIASRKLCLTSCQSCYQMQLNLAKNYISIFIISASSWQKIDGKNCYTGKGAISLLPNPYSDSLSLSECQYACAIDDNCEGVIVRISDERCHKRTNIHIAECNNDSRYNLFIKETGE